MKTNKMKLTAATLIVALTALPCAAKVVKVQSPDKKNTAIVETGRQLTYSLLHGNDTLLWQSPVGLTLGDGTRWGSDAKIKRQKRTHAKEETASPFYKFSSLSSEYNAVKLHFAGGYGIELRAYNEGAAYRFFCEKGDAEYTIENEQADLRLTQDRTVYLSYSTNESNPYAMAFQGNFSVQPLSQTRDFPTYLPATVDYGNGLKMTILESDLESYPGMFLRPDADGLQLKGEFAPYPSKMAYYNWRHMSHVAETAPYIAQCKGARTFPWRAFAITEKDTEMPVNNLVYLLASPNRIGDTGWIKPGLSAWDWWNDWSLKQVDFKAGIDTRTYKFFIDFAQKFGLPYIILDEGWYEPAAGDMLTTIPQIDLPELVRYANEKGVGIVLWCVFNVLDEQLQAACEKYSKMGIKGFKVDFMDRNDQTAVEMAYRIAQSCADHKLVLDYHGFYTPTGFTRTFPNILNVEAVNGIEEFKWCAATQDIPQYDVTFPFIRLMAGPVDYTPGAMRNATRNEFKAVYSHPMSMGTRCHQLACYVIHDSPFTMLCDAPTSYMEEPGITRFIAQMPTAPDETKILQGEIGKYIVTARRKGDDWYIGGYTNWQARDLTLSLDFLPAGQKYNATLVKDGPNVDKQACDYTMRSFVCDNSYREEIKMGEAGGFAVILKAIK